MVYVYINVLIIMLITVFTPTYNRAHLLFRVYESLCRQTYKDFEWLIVDDGSTDGTENLPFLNDTSKVNIRYIKQTNGGKHRAINRGVKEARGELFFILDSDDMISADSLETVKSEYETIHGDLSFCGICGYMAHSDGNIIGRGCGLERFVATSIEMRYKYHVCGDMMEVFRTDVLREFRFPEIDIEKFCPEQLVWFRIAQKYKLSVFSKVIYIRDYLDGGLTDRIVKIRMNSPIASMMTYQEMTTYVGVPLKEKIKAAINYYRFRFCWNGTNDEMIPKINFKYSVLAPLGYIMHLMDIR